VKVPLLFYADGLVRQARGYFCLLAFKADRPEWSRNPFCLGFARICLNLFGRPRNALLLPSFSASAAWVIGKVTPGTGYGTFHHTVLFLASINRVGKVTPGTGYGTSRSHFLANSFRVGQFPFEAGYRRSPHNDLLSRH
jgi:hypothetical protein